MEEFEPVAVHDPTAGPLTANLLASLLRRTELFVEVGAGREFLTVLATNCNPTLDIIAVEPQPAALEALARNMQRRNGTRVELHGLTVADAIGPATTTVDVLLQSRRPGRLVLRLSTGGKDLAILRGMSETLARFPDTTLLVHLDTAAEARLAGARLHALLEELYRIGFSAFGIDDRRKRFQRIDPEAGGTELGHGICNLYCVRRERAMSACFFSHASGLMGAERILMELVDDLIGEYGVLCTVVLPRVGPLVAKLEAVGAACIVSPYRWWCASENESSTDAEKQEGLQKSVKGLLQSVLPDIRALDPDVVWTNSIVIPWGAALAAHLGKPHVWYVLEYGERDHGLQFFSPMSTVTREILESSDLVFALSRSVAEALFAGTPRERVRLLYCHVPPPPTANQSEQHYFHVPAAVRIGIFSQVRASKGQEDIVRATVQLAAIGRNVELLVVGPGYPEYLSHLMSIVRAGGVEDRVTFTGFLEDPYSAMQACDIIAVCSRNEALGRAGIEAMMLGKPVIYPLAGGVPEYMVAGESGLPYSPGDVLELVTCLEQLISDPARRSKMGSFARGHAEKLFSRDKFSGEVYRAFLGLRAKGRVAMGMPGSVAPLWMSSVSAQSSLSVPSMSKRLEELRKERLFAYPAAHGPGSRSLVTQRTHAAPRRRALARRLLEAYRRAALHKAPNGLDGVKEDLWMRIFQKELPDLLGILETGAAPALADYLQSFGERVMWFGGLTLGVDGYRPSDEPHEIASLYVDKVVRLAEAVGAITADCPEQGQWGQRPQRDVDQLIASIESEIGMSIMAPAGIVHTVGVPGAKGVIHYRQLNAAYAGWRTAGLAGAGGRVCEYGAGLGLTAMYARRLGVDNYTIFDLPVVNVFAGHYLLNAVGDDAVCLYGEQDSPSKIKVLPHWCCTHAGNASFDLSLNLDSFPEIDGTVLQRYVAEIARSTTRYFLSINQEAQSPISASRNHVSVSLLLKGDPRFRRLQRFPYWIREGYVEELYEIISTS